MAHSEKIKSLSFCLSEAYKMVLKILASLIHTDKQYKSHL